jgi:hypothetical protein
MAATGAIVGVGPAGSAFYSPFTSDDSKHAEKSITVINWLRDLDRAVLDPELGAMFGRAASKDTKRLCWAVWAAARCDLCSKDTVDLLKGLVDVVPDISVIKALESATPVGLFTMLRFIMGKPTQVLRSERAALQPVFTSSASASTAGFAPVSAVVDGAFRAAAENTSALRAAGFIFPCGNMFCTDLSVFKVADLITLFGVLMSASPIKSGEVLDCFGALVHQCLNMDYEYTTREEEFLCKIMRQDYVASHQPILAVWNMVMKLCLDNEALVRSVQSLYFLNRDMVLRRKSCGQLQLHAHYVCLFSLMGYLLPAVCSKPVEATASQLTCPWLFGVKTTCEAAEAYAAIQTSVWDSCFYLPSCKRLVVETQVLLPAIMVSRSQCCFSDRIVTCDDDLLL